ncbi:MAG TPA: NAD(P)-binding domain-containing protein, partial [Kofleriaceae bacterium]
MSILASHTIGFIGAGNMAEALIRGLVTGHHVPAERILASAPRQERIDELQQRYGIYGTRDNVDVVNS